MRPYGKKQLSELPSVLEEIEELKNNLKYFEKASENLKKQIFGAEKYVKDVLADNHE